MSFLDFYNKEVSLLEIFYDSHCELIEKLCYEFGHPEKALELQEKYLDKQIKLKAKKDPNRPKKPRSSYLFFSEKYRADNKASLEGVSITEVSKLIGNTWQSLSPEVKQEFEQLALNDKERYRADYENYQQALFNPLLKSKESEE
jgi:hypothetical protein